MTKVAGMMKNGEVKEAICLGGDVASLHRGAIDSRGQRYGSDVLTFCGPSSWEDSVYTPAESFTVKGDEILLLRDFLNHHYPVEQKIPENPDIVALFKEHPTMIIHFTMKDDLRVDEDTLYTLNDFGKIFYDRGFAVNSEYSNATGVRRITITHKEKAK